jgi:outer membrane protein OmpA-like peptidoglycan-associated protein
MGLASKGVTTDRIQTEGAGDTVPKGDAATSRRVEIQLNSGGAKPEVIWRTVS